MYFSKILLPVLAGTATASSFLHDLNRTELAAVLAGAGPVITETITVTKHLAVIPTRTPHYQSLHVPIRLTCHPSSSMSISEKQIVPGRHIFHFSVSPEMTGPVTFSAYDRGLHWHRTRKHRSTAVASETSIPQPTTTSENFLATRYPTATHYYDMLRLCFGYAIVTPQLSVSEPTTTSELPKSTEGMKSSPIQNKFMKRMSDIEIVVGTQTIHPIQTIHPTWSIATKKWHGPFKHPKSTAVASAPAEEETVGAVAVTTGDAPVVIASAFKA